MNEDLLIKKRIRLIARAFPEHFVDRDGLNISVNCVNKSCSTYSRKDKKKLCLRVDNEFYHCWVCGFRGKGISNFFRKYKSNFFDEAQALFKKIVEKQNVEKDELLELPRGFKLFANDSNITDPDLRDCRDYLVRRGMSRERMWFFKLGGVTSGRFRRRVIVPSFDSSGELNYFTARAIDEDQTRKYMNPKVTRSDIIFNEAHLDWKKELTIVEGPFDLFKCNQNATCLLGSSLNERHALFSMIAKNLTPVLLALDKDADKKTQDIASLLSSYDIPVRIADVSLHDDVGAMTIDDFKKTRESAKGWSRNDRLRSLIGTIRSGSLV